MHIFVSTVVFFTKNPAPMKKRGRVQARPALSFALTETCRFFFSTVVASI
jgi:hypothetical protein